MLEPNTQLHLGKTDVSGGMCTTGNRSKPCVLRKRAHAAEMWLTFYLATLAALLLEVVEMIAVGVERGVEGFPPELASCDVTA